jgi:hypothetical protein
MLQAAAAPHWRPRLLVDHEPQLELAISVVSGDLVCCSWRRVVLLRLLHPRRRLDGAADATPVSVYWGCCRCSHCILDLDAGGTVPRTQPRRRLPRYYLHGTVS